MKQVSKPATPYFQELLLALFEFMLASGTSQKDISSIAAKALSSATERIPSSAFAQHGGLAGAALVLDAWHRRNRYVDEYGRPKPIPLLGRHPSVEALIRAELPQANAPRLARQLSTLGLAVPFDKNKCLPIGPIARISELHPIVQKHVADAILNLLETVKKNVESGSARPKLLERFAEVPDLPVALIPEFREFSEEQGWAFLRTLNDWLESRRACRQKSRRSRKAVRVGLQVYAYIGTPRAGKTASSR